MPADSLDLRSATGLLALQSLTGIGPRTALRAALQGPTCACVLRPLDRAELDRAFEAARESVAAIVDAGVQPLAFFDSRYPERLRQIADPPPILFVQGDVSLPGSRELVAVVGTREPSPFGRSAARALTKALASAGLGIVSGLSNGVDSIAHAVALEQGAPTIAVVGGGLDRLYPAGNRRLAEEILRSGGALISEQPFGVRPRPSHLAARDRIQSALSLAVVVAETDVESGTMHTVRHAAAQGRLVFCASRDSEPARESGDLTDRSSACAGAAPGPGCEAASEGSRLLLEAPSSELWRLVPAWRTARRLCSSLGEAPLASAVDLERLGDLVAEISGLAAERSQQAAQR